LQDSSIIIRVQKFLSTVPPFVYFSQEDLHTLSTHSAVGVYKAHSSIFNQGESPKDVFYIVKKGAVDIIDPTGDADVLTDKCGEEDMFGIRPLLAESTYRYSATTTEDTILYEIPLERFKEMYKEYEEAVDYMVQRFAAGHSIRDEYSPNPASRPAILVNSLPLKIDLKKPLVSSSTQSNLGEAISTMHEAGVSSIIIVNDIGHPLGILTDRDLRRLVATNYDPSVPIGSVMSKPVKTIPPTLLLQEIQLTMIESGLHHLCVTEDGSRESKAIGMVTEHDVLYASATDPVVILKKLKSASNINALLEVRHKIDAIVPTFLYDDINRKITLSLIDRLNRSLIQRVVEVSLKEYNATNPPISSDTFSFYNMGSAARGEQLLMTDQDNGLIINDNSITRKKDYLAFAKSINDNLNTIGYEYCPANMMAGNEDWCKTLTEMKALTEQWILSPGPQEVLMTSIFFDARHEYGNESLFQDLQNHISNLLTTQDAYIRFLAKQAIANPPPLSFFRKFIVEKDGDHKDRFDIKLRALASLSDCARVLALDHTFLSSSNTLDRYEAMKQEDEANVVLYDDACESYLDLLHFRLQFALKNKDSGRYINISELQKIDKIRLRRAFNPTRSILNMIERIYHLAYL